MRNPGQRLPGPTGNMDHDWVNGNINATSLINMLIYYIIVLIPAI
jgi:hypothetical protein